MLNQDSGLKLRKKLLDLLKIKHSVSDNSDTDTDIHSDTRTDLTTNNRKSNEQINMKPKILNPTKFSKTDYNYSVPQFLTSYHFCPEKDPNTRAETLKNKLF